MRRALALLGACLGAACAPAAPPPRAGEPPKREIVLSTAANDRQAGEEGAKEVAAELGLVADPALLAYVGQVGQRLALGAPGADFAYTFQIVDQDAPNAFALPGGFVYISRGLLDLANDEDELANVIGHEIVHVARRHASARQSVMQAIPGLFQPFAMARIAAYSRDQERDADRLGQSLAALAGYDPEAMATFLRQLDLSERLHLGISRMPSFRDTHPATGERVADAAARGRALTWQRQPGIARDRDDYLRRIDGLVVGTAAAEGVFQHDRFLHPGLGFSMRFPADWEVLNTRRAVGATSPQRSAQVYLEVQGPGDDPEAAAREYMEDEAHRGVRLSELQPLKLGDLPAVRGLGTLSTPQAPLRVHLTWFVREGTVYRLTGLASGSPGKLEGVFNSVARSFRPLTPRERAGVRETRLRIAVARAGESIGELSQRTHNTWDIQQTAVMNGIFADATLAEGQKLKVALSEPYQGEPER